MTRWWQLKYFWNFHPDFLGEMIQFDDHIFSNGLVQPPTRMTMALIPAYLTDHDQLMGFGQVRWTILWTCNKMSDLQWHAFRFSKSFATKLRIRIRRRSEIMKWINERNRKTRNERQSKSRWWFQIFFIFTPIWGRFPIWLIFFRWVETTNQKYVDQIRTRDALQNTQLRILMAG